MSMKVRFFTLAQFKQAKCGGGLLLQYTETYSHHFFSEMTRWPGLTILWLLVQKYILKYMNLVVVCLPCLFLNFLHPSALLDQFHRVYATHKSKGNKYTDKKSNFSNDNQIAL